MTDFQILLCHMTLMTVVYLIIKYLSCVTHTEKARMEWTPKKLLRNQKCFYEIQTDLALVGNGRASIFLNPTRCAASGCYGTNKLQ